MKNRLVMFCLMCVGAFYMLTSVDVYGETEGVDPYDNKYTKELWELGVLRQPLEIGYLEEEVSRLDGLVTLMNLLGLDDEAEVLDKSKSVFDDVPEWAVGYVNYAFLNRIVNGRTESEFGTYDGMQVKSYVTLILRSLGYSDNEGDFTWNTSIEFGKDIGLIGKNDYDNDYSGMLLGEDLAKLLCNALELKVKDSDVLLGTSLAAEGAIDPVAAYDLGFVEDSELTFVDPVFERFMKEALGKESIMYSDALKIATIIIDDKIKVETNYSYGSLPFENIEETKYVTADNQINTLVDLEQFSNLKYLYCSVPINETISISNTELEKLSIGNNSVDIRDMKSTELTRISFYNNDLVFVKDLQKFTGLEMLEIKNCDLPTISMLDGMTNLTTLILSNSKIKNIEYIDDMLSLQTLDLSGNNITDISALKDLTALKYISLQNNEISDISSLSGIENLYTLRLDNNQISDVSALANMTKLTSLKLDKNWISQTESLRGLIRLQDLSIHSNLITDVWQIGKIASLENLNLNSNSVTSLLGLSELNNLKTLSVNNNKIKTVDGLGELYNIEEVSLDDNKITEITGLESLDKLEVFSANDNIISDIEGLYGLDNLNELDLSENSLDDIDVIVSLDNLEKLNLEDNDIDDITALAENTKLEKLYLENNHFTDATPLESLENLTELTLHRFVRGDNIGVAIKEYSIYRTMINKIVKAVDDNYLTDYDKLVAIHDYIITSGEYDDGEDTGGLISISSYSGYGMVVYGKGVCSAYTELLQTICDEVGIQCYTVTGTIHEKTDNGIETISHAWNIVKLDRHYYHIDLTWDDIDDEENTLVYTNFLVSDSQIKSQGDRVWNADNYPECSSNSYIGKK